MNAGSGVKFTIFIKFIYYFLIVFSFI